MANKTVGQLVTFILTTVLLVSIVAVLSSAVTLMAINNLFGTALAIDATNVLSLAWLQIIVGGLIRQAKPNA